MTTTMIFFTIYILSIVILLFGVIDEMFLSEMTADFKKLYDSAGFEIEETLMRKTIITVLMLFAPIFLGLYIFFYLRIRINGK
jgi:hypothetical protein